MCVVVVVIVVVVVSCGGGGMSAILFFRIENTVQFNTLNESFLPMTTGFYP